MRHRTAEWVGNIFQFPQPYIIQRSTYNMHDVGFREPNDEMWSPGPHIRTSAYAVLLPRRARWYNMCDARRHNASDTSLFAQLVTINRHVSANILFSKNRAVFSLAAAAVQLIFGRTLRPWWRRLREKGALFGQRRCLKCFSVYYCQRRANAERVAAFHFAEMWRWTFAAWRVSERQKTPQGARGQTRKHAANASD